MPPEWSKGLWEQRKRELAEERRKREATLGSPGRIWVPIGRIERGDPMKVMNSYDSYMFGCSIILQMTSHCFGGHGTLSFYEELKQRLGKNAEV